MTCQITQMKMMNDTGCPVERYGLRITERGKVLFEEKDLCEDLNMLKQFCADIGKLQPDKIHLCEIIEDFVQECAFV